MLLPVSIQGKWGRWGVFREGVQLGSGLQRGCAAENAHRESSSHAHSHHSPYGCCPSRSLLNGQGTDAQRLGLVAQQVRGVLERHGDQDLNLVKEDSRVRWRAAASAAWCRCCCAAAGSAVLRWSWLCAWCCVLCGNCGSPALHALSCAASPCSTLPHIPFPLQGQLAIDYAGLQTVLLSAMQQVLANAQEQKQNQIAFELAVLGLLEVRQSATMAGGGSQAALLSSSSGASASSSLQEASSTVTMAQLMDADDLEMESSTGGSGSDDSDSESETPEPSAGDLEGLDRQQAAQLLMDRLGEQPGARKLYLVRTAADLFGV